MNKKKVFIAIGAGVVLFLAGVGFSQMIMMKHRRLPFPPQAEMAMNAPCQPAGMNCGCRGGCPGMSGCGCAASRGNGCGCMAGLENPCGYGAEGPCEGNCAKMPRAPRPEMMAPRPAPEMLPVMPEKGKPVRVEAHRPLHHPE